MEVERTTNSQFQDGSINTGVDLLDEKLNPVSQFHDGSINMILFLKNIVEILMLSQFHDGSINIHPLLVRDFSTSKVSIP